MHSLNDYEVWKQRAEEMRREVEVNRMARAARGSRPGLISAFWWELRRDAGRLRKVFRRGGGRLKALELKNVEKGFRKRRGETVRALDDISLSVGRGEVVGILGPNGSGKSTLVRIISTLVMPDSGAVEVFSVDAVKHPKKVQQSMNRVSVEASFFKKLSAMENLLYGAKLYGVTERRGAAADTGDPDPHWFRAQAGYGADGAPESRHAAEDRVGKGAADQPDTHAPRRADDGPGPPEQKDVQRFIRGIREEHDSSILLCTHDMDEAEELCDRVGILVDGKLLALEEPEALKRRYAENGKVTTLEETFMAATGYSVEEAKTEE